MQYLNGMDHNAVNDSGGKLISYSNELDGVIGSINGSVAKIKSNWGGHDADQFNDDWSRGRVFVKNCADSLQQMGKKCQTNAKAQEAASK